MTLSLKQHSLTKVCWYLFMLQAEAEAEDCMNPNKNTAVAAEESEEKKKKNDIELTGSSGMPSDCNKTNNCPSASHYDGWGKTIWIVEFLRSHLENNPLLCVEINYELKATYRCWSWWWRQSWRWERGGRPSWWKVTLCCDNYQLSSLPTLHHRHRLGQTEPRWGRNALKDKPEEDKSQQSDLSGEVIVGRLTVVFDAKNKCEKIETKQTVTSAGQLLSDPPFPSSIRSLTQSPSQKQNR